MRRLFWLALGATVGGLAMRKLSKLAERLTPRGMAGRLGDGLVELSGALREFGGEVRGAMRAREAELREGVELDGQLGRSSGKSGR